MASDALDLVRVPRSCHLDVDHRMIHSGLCVEGARIPAKESRCYQQARFGSVDVAGKAGVALAVDAAGHEDRMAIVMVAAQHCGAKTFHSSWAGLAVCNRSTTVAVNAGARWAVSVMDAGMP